MTQSAALTGIAGWRDLEDRWGGPLRRQPRLRCIPGRPLVLRYVLPFEFESEQNRLINVRAASALLHSWEASYAMVCRLRQT